LQKSKNFSKSNIYSAFVISFAVFVIYGLVSKLIYGDKILSLLYLLWKNIFIGIIIISISYIFRYLRWRFLMSNIGFKPPIFKDIFNWLASFAFTATPGKLGELIRINFLYSDFKIPRSLTFSLIVIEKISDLLSVFILLIFNIGSYPILSSKLNLNYFLFIGALLIGFIIFFRRYISFKFVKKIIPIYIYEKSISAFYSIKLLLKLDIIVISLLLGIFAWFIECFSLFILVSGVKDFYLSVSESIFTHASSTLLGVISMIPGGIGASELTSSNILTYFGISLDSAIVLSFILRLITIWYATMIGFLFLFIRKFISKN